MPHRSRESQSPGDVVTTGRVWPPVLPARNDYPIWHFRYWQFSLRDSFWALAVVCCFITISIQAYRYFEAFDLYEGSHSGEVRFMGIDVGPHAGGYLALVGQESLLDIELYNDGDPNAAPVDRITLLPGRNVISCRVVERNGRVELECITGHECLTTSLPAPHENGYSVRLSIPRNMSWSTPEQTVARVEMSRPGDNREMTMKLKYIPNKKTRKLSADERRRQREEAESWRSFFESVPPLPDFNHN